MRLLYIGGLTPLIQWTQAGDTHTHTHTERSRANKVGSRSGSAGGEEAAKNEFDYPLSKRIEIHRSDAYTRARAIGLIYIQKGV